MFISNVSYSPGDVIVSCHPFVHVLVPEAREVRCYACLNSSKSLKSCGGCFVVKYCTKDCQKRDWTRYHKHECQVFKKAKEVESPILDMTMEMLMLRTYLMLENQPHLASQAFLLSNGTQRTFDDLMTNLEFIEKDIKKMNSIERLCQLVSQIMPIFDKSRFLSILGKISTNSFSIQDEKTDEKIGHSIRVPTAVFNHSCQPNATSLTKGLTQEIRSLNHIMPGQEVTVSYIDLLQTREHRRRELKENWYFDCECKRCSSPDLDHQVLRLKKKDQQMKSLMTRSVQDEEAKSKEMYYLGLEIIADFEVMLGQFHPLITIMMHGSTGCRLHASSKFKDQRDLKKILKRLKNAILVTHGSDHPLFQRYQELLVM